MTDSKKRKLGKSSTHYSEPSRKTPKKIPHAEIARMLGMEPNAVKQAANRLRERYQSALRDEVAIVVNAHRDDPAVDEEIRALHLLRQF